MSSVLAPTSTSAARSVLPSGFIRTFASSSRTCFPPKSSPAASSDGETPSNRKPQLGRKPLGAMNIRFLEDFEFDDVTSLGLLRLEKIKEAQELVRKVQMDRAVLQSQRRPFTPPTGSIRIQSTIDLSNPSSPYHVKKVLLAPVASLPLQGPDAVHRCKLLAGPRWTPGQPGSEETESAAEGSGKEGWIKISEERFPDGGMNRKSASDTLERLVQAANDSKSTLPRNSALDTRHLLARQSKKHQRNAQHIWRRSEALKARPDIVGGIRGFPVEWLAQETKHTIP